MQGSDEAFDRHRGVLFAVAYRMLASVADAEDVVQEAFLRWQPLEKTQVRSTEAFLTSIVTRLSIDALRRRHREREHYIGPWLPEPLVEPARADAVDAAALADSLSMALLVVLESLSPIERAVFLLREVFDYDFEQIAQIVEKTSTNCRQIFHRAREHVATRRSRFAVPAERQRALTDEFLAACRSGEIAQLERLLAEDVVLYSDGGGQVPSARRPIVGQDHVARFLLGIAKKMPAEARIESAQVNGSPGFIVWQGDAPRNVWTLDFEDGRVCRVYAVNNPDKLRHVSRAGKTEGTV